MEKRHLRDLVKWHEAKDHLAGLGVDDDTLQRIEAGMGAMDMIATATDMFAASADESQARNYIALQLAGVRGAWDRMYVELIRPGAKHSSEVASDLKRDLHTVLIHLAQTEYKATAHVIAKAHGLSIAQDITNKDE